ncbi:MAG: septal ring lytic transglycosylase RlpA family lipoprotein [Roseateles depolymerans]|uniref:Endolytic peptidoglycan transglycosylase RlpA n=1 Tax=Roseateles depolymerans TaxID=76731 RepID=A0A2W5DWF0_9BURK|nr:MAG: septal ring lytic transglycosylase RlpA family lipoprotein [Roseateles depolymerans]
MTKAQHSGAALLVLAALFLGGCATRAPAPLRDGPAASTPSDLAKRPDAEPRIDPVRSGGPNKPYEVMGQRYVPLSGDPSYSETGLASWYGRQFHGRSTSSGEIYDMFGMTAAHATLPIPSYARVRNPANGREVVVRVNDRGPFHPGRIIDLSYTAALKLDLLRGVAPVQVTRITQAEIRAGNWQRPANEPPPLYAPEAAPGAPQRDTTATLAGVATAGTWLQFGAFAQRDGAETLKQRVASADLELLPLLTIVDEGGLHRVRAGPFPDAAEARAWALRLRLDHAIDSALVDKR